MYTDANYQTDPPNLSQYQQQNEETEVDVTAVVDMNKGHDVEQVGSEKLSVASPRQKFQHQEPIQIPPEANDEHY